MYRASAIADNENEDGDYIRVLETDQNCQRIEELCGNDD